jgi:hypothetical protein
MSRDTVLTNRQGKKVPIRYGGACLRDADGSPAGVVLVFRDATFQSPS